MINIAIIGVGYWGPNLLRNFNGLSGIGLLYACDMEEANLDKVKRTYPHLRVTKNYLDVITNEKIDAVCIATPLSAHFEIAKKALLNNKHVLVEKPFTSNSEEAEELIQIAKEKGKILMVDHPFIYAGAIDKIKELIDKGELGEVYYFDSERINLGLIRSDANVIWDLAAHDISIVDYLFSQKPISVSAVGSSHVLNKKEEMAHITLSHQKGLISHIHVSWLSPLKLRKILVGGSKKMILYDDVEPSDKIRIYDKGVDIDPKQITPFNPLYRSGDVVIPKINQSEPLRRLTEHFVECAEKNQKPLTDGEAGLRVIKILEAIQASINQKGKEIALE